MVESGGPGRTPGPPRLRLSTCRGARGRRSGASGVNLNRRAHADEVEELRGLVVREVHAAVAAAGLVDGAAEARAPGRVVQAVGACGMIPIANAEMGTAFPPEKRGMALGMAASVAGISNIVGAAAGSAILGICGVHNWGWLFFWCLPVCLLLLLGAAKFLPNNTHEAKGRLDLVGAAIFVALICALLLALKSLDFFNLASAANIEVWGMGLAAGAFGVIFALIERRADDPIFHLE